MTGKKRIMVYGADTETDHDGSKAWLVQWAISNGTTEKIGTTLEQFKNALMDISRAHQSFIYFHNLKYDLSYIKYIIYELQNDGWQVKAMLRKGNPIFVTLHNPDNIFYADITFRDSNKKVRGELRQLAKLVGMKKLAGYDFFPGWSKEVDFSEQSAWDYVKMDARIVAVAMQEQHNNGYVSSTFTGDAWRDAHEVINGVKYTKVKRNWEGLFPRLDLETDSALREAYMGGLNISRHNGTCKGTILHADVNSMYPTVMYYDVLPYGLPIRRNTIPHSDLYTIKADFKLKLKSGLIPWFVFKDSSHYILERLPFNTPIKETKFSHTLTLTSVDFELLQKWYDVEISNFVECYEFDSSIGLLNGYIDKWLEIKRNSTKGTLAYTSSKFMLNSLYGRFGLNPAKETVSLGYLEEKKDVGWSSLHTIEPTDAYLPYALFITAYARARLLNYVMKAGPNKVIHCDTDSCIHYGSEAPGISYGKELGDWAIESRPKIIYEGGFKRYVEQLDDEVDSFDSLHIACAGVPNRVNDDGIPIGMWLELWDNPKRICSDDTLGSKNYEIQSDWLIREFKRNNLNTIQNTMKLIPISVPGGYILEERQHKLNDCLMISMR